ncbi:MAG: hypothetical protein MI806_07455 [Minwuiales bacterium]|nr:hypothetical protein [Minwuiales bacterium]
MAAYSTPALRSAFPPPAELIVRNGRRPAAAAVEAYAERQEGAVARLPEGPVERIDAIRRQPRHRPDQVASDGAARADRETRIEKPATAAHGRAAGAVDRPGYSVAFLAQLAGQTNRAYDDAVESRAVADGAAAYRDTADRGIRLLGPEVSANYLI